MQIRKHLREMKEPSQFHNVNWSTEFDPTHVWWQSLQWFCSPGWPRRLGGCGHWEMMRGGQREGQSQDAEKRAGDLTPDREKEQTSQDHCPLKLWLSPPWGRGRGSCVWAYTWGAVPPAGGSWCGHSYYWDGWATWTFVKGSCHLRRQKQAQIIPNFSFKPLSRKDPRSTLNGPTSQKPLEHTGLGCEFPTEGEEQSRPHLHLLCPVGSLYLAMPHTPGYFPHFPHCSLPERALRPNF